MANNYRGGHSLIIAVSCPHRRRVCEISVPLIFCNYAEVIAIAAHRREYSSARARRRSASRREHERRRASWRGLRNPGGGAEMAGDTASAMNGATGANRGSHLVAGQASNKLKVN